MSAGGLTKWEGAQWFASMKESVLASVAQSNRMHVLTAFRVMAWEDLAWGRPFGVLRMVLLGIFRPKALRDLVIAKQNATMAAETTKALDEQAAAEKAADEAKQKEAEAIARRPKKSREEQEALEAALKEQGSPLFAVPDDHVGPAVPGACPKAEPCDEHPRILRADGHGGPIMTMKEIVEAEG